MAKLKLLVNGTPLDISEIDEIKVIAQMEFEYLHFTFTHEGLITDCVDPSLQDEGNEIFASSSNTYLDLASNS